MSNLNECQRAIAETTEGMVVVDAGPGTGKTKTVVDRYLNILKKNVDPKDILLLTFTKNAAREMSDRIKGRMMDENMRGKIKDLRAGTFDSFCLSVVMESPESVSEFFEIDEKLTRSVRLVENDTLNFTYFSDFMDAFLSDCGEDYGNQAILASQYYKPFFRLIGKLMSFGILPKKKGWFGGDYGDALYGNRNSVERMIWEHYGLDTETSKSYMSEVIRDKNYESRLNGISVDYELACQLAEETLAENREPLIRLVHDVYYKFIRKSIADNRLTFGLAASFAYISLYDNAGTRDRMRCKYLIIDEFQDTNTNQFMIALMLLKEPNLCVVGDWKQGIYGFRNVTIENITNFSETAGKNRDFLNDDEERVIFQLPETVKLPLTENYRSSQKVIDAAYESMYLSATEDENLDTETLDKTVTRITAVKTHLDEHSELIKIKTSSKDGEIDEVIRTIHRYVTDEKYKIAEDDGTLRQADYRDIAVLCRKTSTARQIFEKADQCGIPAFLQGDVDLMGSKEGKLMLAWLKYINNRRDRWGIGAILAYHNYPVEEIERMIEFDDIPKELEDYRYGLVKKKRRITNLITSIFDYYGLNNDITQALVTIIASSHRVSLLTISDVINLVETDIREGTTYSIDPSLTKRAVIIQTIHKSKGLEYPIVIIPGIDSKSFPNSMGDTMEYVYDEPYGIRCKKEVIEFNGHKTILDSWKTTIVLKCAKKNYDEERRLMFVAISRAKQYVTFIAGDTPSKFFLNMPDVLSSDEGTGIPDFGEESESGPSVLRPEIDPFVKRRKNIGVHDILRFEGEDIPPEGSDQFCGKGMEYGVKIHSLAEAMARGIKPSPEEEKLPEIPGIIKVLKATEDSLLAEPEIECALPFNEYNATLRGIIDLYVLYPDRVEIHDYKTDVSDRFEEEYEMQLSIYAHAAMEFTGRTKAVCVIDYVSMGTEHRFDPMPKSVIAKRLKEYLD